MYFPMTFLAFIVFILAVFSHTASAKVDPADCLHGEQPVIDNACDRNACTGDLRLLVYAIRLAENGPPGREFGIENDDADDLDKQAGWCAATVTKNYARWIHDGRPGEFIVYLGNRYAPPDLDPKNRNWVGNVMNWYTKFNGHSFKGTACPN